MVPVPFLAPLPFGPSSEAHGLPLFSYGFGYRGTGISAISLAPNRRNKMNLRLIPTSVHGVLDYLASGVNLAFPGLLGLQDAPWAARVPRIDGLRRQATALSLTTNSAC